MFEVLVDVCMNNHLIFNTPVGNGEQTENVEACWSGWRLSLGVITRLLSAVWCSVVLCQGMPWRVLVWSGVTLSGLFCGAARSAL